MTTTSISLQKILYNDENVSLVIRPLQQEDASVLNIAVQESLDNLLPFMDWAHGELSEENQLARIINSSYLQHGAGCDFAVFNSSGDFLVAASWHSSKIRNKKCFEIGYWTNARHCNKGLATLVTKILGIYCF